MPLAVALEVEQIAAAGRLHQLLEGWQSTNDALASLGHKFPGFDFNSVLLKTTCVNALYGTNVLAVHRMARHVVEVLGRVDLPSAGPELIEELAVPPQDDGIVHRHHSFASKFAHFFIDSERFPIMDAYAVAMIKLHLGRTSVLVDPERPYEAFYKNHSLLKIELGSVSNSELDHYLWIAGLHTAYRKNPRVTINREVRLLFENPDPRIVADLATLSSPPSLVPGTANVADNVGQS
jgi:hypothetical protein